MTEQEEKQKVVAEMAQFLMSSNLLGVKKIEEMLLALKKNEKLEEALLSTNKELSDIKIKIEALNTSVSEIPAKFICKHCKEDNFNP